MTLKQRRLVNNTVKAIRENKPYTQKEIAIQSGYSAKGKTEYRESTKKHLIAKLKQLGYSEEEMKERFNLGSELALAKSDLTNYMRANEDISRMQGQFKDKVESDIKFKDITDEAKKIKEDIRNRLLNVIPSEN